VLRQGLIAPAEVEIRIEQERGLYGGEALPDPVQFECGPGEIELGDWSSIAGLHDYSGGAWYRRDINVDADQIGGDVQLDLGRVSSSAEVWVNGVKAGIRLAPPFRVSVGKLLKVGSNTVEVLVYSALDNHYRTIPTRYRRPGVSGLIGPVRLLVSNAGHGQ